MPACETLIRGGQVADGSGSALFCADVAVRGGRIVAVEPALDWNAEVVVEAAGLTLAPGFIDTHTHDDTSVIEAPAMLPKLSQGVTTVITGNCGISAAPFTPRGALPEPMQLLGPGSGFRYSNFAGYARAVEGARPAVHVAALVGHTTLRSQCMDRLDRTASSLEINKMQRLLEASLEAGALGLSTGLAYGSARAASTDEVLRLTELLGARNAVYTTHLRSETAAVLEAMEEAFTVGRASGAPVVVSHLKCAGVDNWGRSGEVLEALDAARAGQQAVCDCYPYAAGSSMLDLGQVDERVRITITWSTPHPELGGRMLAAIAEEWGVPQREATRRLQPAGAIYHSIDEQDMRRILAHPATMIGSDGLPYDPRPHPRLWGTFPRVLGRYSRELGLFSLEAAVHKMTGLPARQFGLVDRGLIRAGYCADLVLFDAARIVDKATFEDPAQPCEGIHGVWVNGELSYTASGATGKRNGQFLRRVG